MLSGKLKKLWEKGSSNGRPAYLASVETTTKPLREKSTKEWIPADLAAKCYPKEVEELERMLAKPDDMDEPRRLHHQVFRMDPKMFPYESHNYSFCKKRYDDGMARKAAADRAAAPPSATPAVASPAPPSKKGKKDMNDNDPTYPDANNSDKYAELSWNCIKYILDELEAERAGTDDEEKADDEEEHDTSHDDLDDSTSTSHYDATSDDVFDDSVEENPENEPVFPQRDVPSTPRRSPPKTRASARLNKKNNDSEENSDSECVEPIRGRALRRASMTAAKAVGKTSDENTSLRMSTRTRAVKSSSPNEVDKENKDESQNETSSALRLPGRKRKTETPIARSTPGSALRQMLFNELFAKEKPKNNGSWFLVPLRPSKERVEFHVGKKADKTLIDQWRLSMEQYGTAFSDYYHRYQAMAMELLRSKLERRRYVVTDRLVRKCFWNQEYKQNIRSDLSHIPLYFAQNNLKALRKTESVVKCILACSLIGAVCERCDNPLGLEEEERLQLQCKCKKPKPSAFFVQTEGRTVQEQEEEWEVKYKEELEKTIEGLRKRIIEEMDGDVDLFEKRFTKHRDLLEKRTDDFGKALYKRQLALNALRKKALQPPTFLFSWTPREELFEETPRMTETGLPKEWSPETECELSEGAKEALSGRKDYHKCVCTADCSTSAGKQKGKKCCEDRGTLWRINEDGLLRTKHGLAPCGTEEGSMLQPFERSVVVGVCEDGCNCPSDCALRFPERASSKMKILFRTEETGWHFRIAEETVRGELLLNFAGRVMTTTEIEEYGMCPEMIYPLKSLKGTKVGDELAITTDIKANEFRSVNHCCEPNGLMVCTYGKKWGEAYHGLSLFARRDGCAYEQWTFDYFCNPEDAKREFPFPCRCGAATCRGFAV